MAKTPNKRAVRPQDVFIGERIRQARIEAGMSQIDLGAKLNVSFQQVQKYEKGFNRVSGSRFEPLAAALGKPVQWFFATGNGAAKMDPTMSKFVSTKEGNALASKFFRLTPTARNLVLDLVEQLGRVS